MDKPDLSRYYAACRQAADGDGTFQTFRSNRAVCGVTDTNTREHGLECEREIITKYHYLLPWLDSMRRFDEYGMPVLYRFQHVGLFNPTTLRHIVTLGQIAELMRGTAVKNIVEIGCGYGMLAALQLIYFPIQRYILYDQVQVSRLAVRFLSSSSFYSRVQTEVPGIDPLQETFKPDIAISCYALSELDTTEQDWYIDNVLKHARAGFLVMNSCNNGYPRETMIARLQAELDTKVHCEREIPLTHKDNYTLLWKHGGNDGQ